MKAVVVHAPSDIRWEEVSDPVIPAGWVKGGGEIGRGVLVRYWAGFA